MRLLLEAYWTGKADINDIITSGSDNDVRFYKAVHPQVDLKNIDLIRPAAMLKMATHIAAKPFIKTHHANCVANGMAVIPPSITSQALYIYRDPRDVAISTASHFGVTIDQAIEWIADDARAVGKDGNYLHYVSSWSEHTASWLKLKDFDVIGIKYEDLLKDTTAELHRILARMGKIQAGKSVAKAVELADFKRLQEQEKASGFIEQSDLAKDRFFRVGRSQWEDVLTEEQAHKIEVAHQQMMRELGYALVTI